MIEIERNRQALAEIVRQCRLIEERLDLFGPAETMAAIE